MPAIIFAQIGRGYEEGRARQKERERVEGDLLGLGRQLHDSALELLSGKLSESNRDERILILYDSQTKTKLSKHEYLY